MTTLATAARNAAANGVVDLIDAGSGQATGSLYFLTAGAVGLCECLFANPAFGNAATGVATANAIGTGTVAGSSNPSTITQAQLRDRDDTVVVTCTVGLSASDINLSAVAVNDGDTITISSLTYTQPAS